jgi:hypothetical protein
MAALLAHESQHTDPAATVARVREWIGANGVAAGFGEGRSAEAFRVVDTA